MSGRNDTGIFNSQAFINDYVRSLRTATISQPQKVSIIPLCEMLLKIMGEQAYEAWVWETPDDDEGFQKAAIAKLKELTIGRSR